MLIMLIGVGICLNATVALAGPGVYSGVKLYCHNLSELQDVITQEHDYKFYGGDLESSSDWHGLPYYNYIWFENGIEDEDRLAMQEICPEIDIEELEPIAIDYGEKIINTNSLSLSHLFVVKRNPEWTDSDIEEAVAEIEENLQETNDDIESKNRVLIVTDNWIYLHHSSNELSQFELLAIKVGIGIIGFFIVIGIACFVLRPAKPKSAG